MLHDLGVAIAALYFIALGVLVVSITLGIIGVLLR